MSLRSRRPVRKHKHKKNIVIEERVERSLDRDGAINAGFLASGAFNEVYSPPPLLGVIGATGPTGPRSYPSATGIGLSCAPACYDTAGNMYKQAIQEMRLEEDKKAFSQIDIEPYGPDSFGGSDFDLDPASVDESLFGREGFAEAETLMKNLRNKLPPPEAPQDLFIKYIKGDNSFDEKEAWIQTYSGKRFTPMKPNPQAIVIQDIAHALAMQCRFSGHVKEFYSVAQHCVLVSYICNHEDALWGLLHDATEAYLVDVPRPLKKSGKFGAYTEAEKVMQDAICERFGLSKEEPESVHKADTVLLATEARDLMGPLRYDWTQPVKALPFKIAALGPREAKVLYLERFFELIGCPDGMQSYLHHESFGSL